MNNPGLKPKKGKAMVGKASHVEKYRERQAKFIGTYRAAYRKRFGSEPSELDIRILQDQGRLYQEAQRLLGNITMTIKHGASCKCKVCKDPTFSSADPSHKDAASAVLASLGNKAEEERKRQALLSKEREEAKERAERMVKITAINTRMKDIVPSAILSRVANGTVEVEQVAGLFSLPIDLVKEWKEAFAR